jgi:HNH endonuclease
MNPFYPSVALRARHICEYCHAPEVIFNFPFEVEHIVPIALAGADAVENMALACRSCNLWKSIRITSADPVNGDIVRLYNPREDQWEEHFAVVLEEGTIVGQTPIGRATVAQLRFNAPAQQLARHQWMRLSLFP